MMCRTTIAGLLAGVVLCGPALAQTGAQQPMQPGAAAPIAQPGQAGMAGQSMQQGALRPMANPQPNQMLASDLRGTTVYGANNENVGPINDLLLDRDGRVAAVIVGVGGFLGIGQKDVAVPYQALEIMADDRMARTGAGATDATATGTVNRGAGMTGTGAAGTGSTGLTGAGSGMATSGVGPTGTGPTATGGAGTAATGTGATGMGSTGTGAAAGAGGNASMGAPSPQGGDRVATLSPQRVVLRGMTRADLENAPAFRADGRGAR